MPSLAGIYDLQKDSIETEATLAKMARVLDIPSIGYTVCTAVGRRAGCTNLLRPTANPRQPARDEEDGLWLMLDGELYNADELRASLRERGVACDTGDDAGLCLALYRTEGEGFVRRLNGQFNLAIYSEPKRVLVIANDRYAYRPLFIAESGPRFLFANEMKAIIAVLDQTPRVDGVGLLQIVREGTALGDRTWLDPIRVLEPGTVLRITPAGVERQRYFRFRYRDGGATVPAPAFVDEFAVRLRRAAERVMVGPARIGISLSGGLDSRSVLLSIPRPRLPITAYTFGYPESRDVMYARMLADLLGLHHFHLIFDPGYLGRVVSPVTWRNEALFPFVSATSIYFHRRIGAHMDVILNGHCGDALTGSHLRPYMMWTRSRARLIERMFQGRQVVSDEDLRLVFHPSFYNRYAPDLFDAMRATFADIENEEIPNIADAWDMENRQRRGTFHSPSVDRYRFEQRTPFLDNDLVGHLLGAPPRWRFQQVAYKRMIFSAFPHARHVPWAYTGRPLTPYPAVELARIAWNYGRNRASAALAHLNRNGNHLVGQAFRDLRSELRTDRSIAQRILDFADSAGFPGDVFDRAGIREVVRRHWEAGADCTHLVGTIATFAEAYRLFLFERPSTIPPEADPLVCGGQRQ